MNSVATGNAVPQTAPTAQASPTQQSGGGYNQVMNQRMGRGLGGYGSFGNFGGGFGGGGGMPFNISGYGGMDAGLGGYGGFGGFNPMMMGGFGGFSPMMGFGGFGGFNPMMMGGFGFNPMMAMGLGAFGGYGGFGFNPMMMGGYGNQFAQQQEQPDFPPQMAQRYNPNVYNPRENAQRQMQQQFQQRESSMTDYQKLMERQRTANMPRPPSSPSMSGGFGLDQLPVTAPSDLEIANSLGYKGAGSANFMTDMRAKMPHEYEAEHAANNAKAKEYLNSIGYGQAGFDPSKYEVRRPPVSTGPRTGLGLFLGA